MSDNIGSPACSPDPGGKKTPEGVIKRHGGLGHGGNADLMAEMREKRASMAMHPKAQGSQAFFCAESIPLLAKKMRDKAVLAF